MRALPGVLLACAAGCASAGEFARGADVSWVSEMGAAGRQFYNHAGQQRDLFALLREQGLNAVRLRIWVNPTDGYNGIADTIAKAHRAQQAGLRIMLDFHYSDSWADPQQQNKPAAWSGYSVPQLAHALAQHTRASLRALRDAGITPEWVQVGNETRDGMLWPDGRASTHMRNYARFIDSGYAAVKSVFPAAPVIVHVDNCHDNARFRWHFDGLRRYRARFDMIGASAYPTTAPGMDWRQAVSACQANLEDMRTRYGKPVVLAEIGAPWDHPQAPAIVAGLVAVARSAASGVFYWEPQAYNWKDYPMGAFDLDGKPTAGMDALRTEDETWTSTH